MVIRKGKNGNIINSKPCKHCVKLMYETGIRNIYYSTDSGDIIMEQIKYIETEHISILNRYI